MKTINNWTIISLHANDHYQVTGYVEDIPIRTSNLRSIDFENGDLHTLNSTYKLGQHAKGSTLLGKLEENTQVDSTF